MVQRATAVMVVLTLAMVGCIESAPDAHPLEFDGTEYREPVLAPEFTLTDQNGESVSLSDFDGKVIVVAFTYTHCPDVCLAVEHNLAYVHQNLGDLSDDVVIISITIDPARDTVERYANWTAQMGFGWPHLTHADHRDIAQVWEDWNIVVDNDHLQNDHADHGSDGIGSGGSSGGHGNQTGGNGTGMDDGNETQGNETHGNDSTANESQGNQSHGNETHGNESHGNQSQANDGHADESHAANGEHDEHGEEETYLVGHSTVTFIIDASGHKRVAWTGSDWDPTLFLSDLEKLVGEGDTGHDGHGH